MSIAKRIARAVGATFLCLIIVYVLIIITARMSHPDTWVLISFAIVILLSIYFCTFTILAEIRKQRTDPCNSDASTADGKKNDSINSDDKGRSSHYV